MAVLETGFRPALGTVYDALWTRDHAYAIWHDPSLMSVADVRQFVTHRLATRSTTGAATSNGYADFVADRITQAGNVIYRNDGMSERPFMDGIAFIVLMLWSDWHATGHTATYTANKAAINACLAALPRSVNGCVYSDPAAPSVDYGFCDSIKKTGDVAYGTALLAWSYKMLAQVATAAGDTAGAASYTTAYQHARDGLATLRKPSGWYAGSSGNNAAVDDVWVTALAVAENLIADPAERVASAVKIRDAYLASSITLYGWVRHMPTGQHWTGTTTTQDYYQNGAYWLTPLWDCYRAVQLVDPVIAREWAVEAMTTVQNQITVEGVGAEVAMSAPYEFLMFGGHSTPVGYTASAAVLKRFVGLT